MRAAAKKHLPRIARNYDDPGRALAPGRATVVRGLATFLERRRVSLVPEYDAFVAVRVARSRARRPLRQGQRAAIGQHEPDAALRAIHERGIDGLAATACESRLDRFRSSGHVRGRRCLGARGAAR